MDKRLNIDSITNGLLTLQKLKQLYNPGQRDENSQSSVALQPDRLMLLQEILTAITDFLPATRGGSFSEAFRLGSHYSRTYRGIKQHVRNLGSSGNADGAGLSQLLKTLEIVAPVFSSRQKVYMDKVIKIFGILNS